MRVNLDRCCAAVNLAALVLVLASVSAQAADPAKKSVTQKPAANEPASVAAQDSAAESPVERIEAALRRKVTLDFNEKPLQEVVAEIAKAHEINLLLDRRSLDEASVGSDTPITFRADDITLRSALSLMLEPLDCSFTINNEVLDITSGYNAGTLLATRCYPVQDLLAARNAFDEPIDDFGPLIKLILTTVAPTTWDEVGGPGSLAGADGTLVVNHTAEVQEQLADLLTTLRTVREAGNKGLPTSLASTAQIELDAAQKALLAQRVSWHFEETPLGEAMEKIGKEVHYNIRLDVKALDEASVDATMPITFDVKDISFGSAIRRLLRGLDMHYVFKNEVLMITTLDKACQELTTRIYPVGDLLDATDIAADYDELIQAITTTVHPVTWDEVGGPGAIEPFPPARALVISQVREALDEIDVLFESLRALRAKQAAAAQPVEMVTKVYELGVLTPRTQSQPAAKSDPKATVPATPAAAGDGANLPPAVCPAPAAVAAQPLPILEIVGLVQEKVAPESWDGEAKVRIVGAKLLITQTPAVHRRIARLLDEVVGQSVFSSPNAGGGLGGGGGGFFAVPARN